MKVSVLCYILSMDISIESTKCIEQLINDTLIDNMDFNFFGNSSAYLSSIFENQLLGFISIENDIANDDVKLALFLFKDPQSKFLLSKWQVEKQDFKAFLSKNNLDKEEVLNYLIPSQSLPINMSRVFSTSFYLTSMFNSGKTAGFILSENALRGTKDKGTQLVLKMLTNIFLNRQKTLELETKLKLHQQVLDLMPHRFFWKNRDSIYLGANKAFIEDVAKKSIDDILGKNDLQLFKPHDAKLFRRDDAHTMSTRKHLLNFEETQTTPSGKVLWLRVSKRPIINNNNDVIGIIGTYDDITELKTVQRKLLEIKEDLEIRVIQRTNALSKSHKQLTFTLDELEKAQEKLVESAKMAALVGLVSGVAHEINTPVGVAITGTSLSVDLISSIRQKLLEGRMTKEGLEKGFIKLTGNSEMILKNLSRASKLIDNFKLIAVDQSHDTTRKLKLAEFIRTIFNTLSSEMEKYNTNLTVDIDDSISIISFPEALTQIITNLTENSIKHAFLENQLNNISVSAKLDENNEVVIRFFDEGKGIDYAVKEHIFEPFYTTRRGDGNAGLGLSIVYNLCTQKLRGKIAMDSEYETGALFIITFPAEL
jgi:two-component system autoinducer 2 sensor kinase/phosphatase LuxQ